jgi:hypothetical protein
MPPAIPASSAPEERRAWVRYLADIVGASGSPVWGWLAAVEPGQMTRLHLPVNRVRPLDEWSIEDKDLQGGAEFWVLTRYQGHVLVAVVPNVSGAWSVRSDRFESWGWS